MDLKLKACFSVSEPVTFVSQNRDQLPLRLRYNTQTVWYFDYHNY